MKFSFAALKGDKASRKGDLSDKDLVDSAEERSEEELPQAVGKLKVASIVWAIAVYLIERERQRTKVELARLEREAKKQVSSNFPSNI